MSLVSETCMTNKNAIYFFIKFTLFDSGFATLIFIRLQFIDISCIDILEFFI